MKGIILAGGTGSRLGALTRGTNKHLLPLGREPMLFRAVWALDEAGLSELAVVTGREHTAAFTSALRPWSGCLLSQERPGGIAQALGVTSEWAGGEAAVVLLADNVWERSLRPWVEAFGRQGRGARVLLSRQESGLDQCGVPCIAHDTGRIRRVEEKPALPSSPYAVTGAYAFDETVWDILPTLQPSARGEREITDVLNAYAERGQLEHDVIDGYWADAGQSVEAYYAAVDFVRRQEAA
jgi:glucose-1-phosphate thymidylyltransferase